jgi:hypothetical protein
VGFGSGAVGCWPVPGVAGAPGPDGAGDPGPAGPVGVAGVDGDGGHGPWLGAGLVVGVGDVVGVAEGLAVPDSVEPGCVTGGAGGAVGVSVELGDVVGVPDGDPVGEVVGVGVGQGESAGFASLVGVLGFTVPFGRSKPTSSATAAPASTRDTPAPASPEPGLASAVDAVAPSAAQPITDSTSRLPRRRLACRRFRATSPAPPWSDAGFPAILRMSLPHVTRVCARLSACTPIRRRTPIRLFHG